MNDNLYTEVKIPQPEEVDVKDKENAFGSYILMFAGAYFPIPFIELVLSIAYYNYFKKRSRYVAFHTYQSLLSQIPITLINTAFVTYAVYIFITNILKEIIVPINTQNLFYIFLIMIVILNLIYNIVSLVIALKAKKGVIRYIPIIGKIAYDKIYGVNAIDIGTNSDVKKEINRAP